MIISLVVCTLALGICTEGSRELLIAHIVGPPPVSQAACTTIARGWVEQHRPRKDLAPDTMPRCEGAK